MGLWRPVKLSSAVVLPLYSWFSPHPWSQIGHGQGHNLSTAIKYTSLPLKEFLQSIFPSHYSWHGFLCTQNDQEQTCSSWYVRPCLALFHLCSFTVWIHSHFCQRANEGLRCRFHMLSVTLCFPLYLSFLTANSISPSLVLSPHSSLLREKGKWSRLAWSGWTSPW